MASFWASFWGNNYVIFQWLAYGFKFSCGILEIPNFALKANS